MFKIPKNRANDVAALLSNWQNVEAAVKSANEAEGSAARENAKYVDSLQGRLDKLTTAWQSFANTFMNSDLLKGGVSALTDILQIVEKIVEAFGSFGTIGLVAGIVGIVKNFGTLKTILSSLVTKTAGAAIGFKALTSSFSGVVGGIGLLVSALGLIYNAYKKNKEAAEADRQEIIESSNAYLDAASNFEKAYIKYSGKTDLTAEEEAELEAAIKGAAEALGDKNSELQNTINSSNDYIASLERIKDAELEAAEAAAINKRDKAAESLKEAAVGWESWDGSEVDVALGSNKAAEIAKEVGGDFYKEITSFMPHAGGADLGVQEYETFKLELSGDADINDIVDYYNTLNDYKEALSDAGLTESADFKAVETAIEKMSESISVYIDGVYEAVKANYQLNEGIPKTTEEYIAMREAILSDTQLDGFSLDKKMTILNDLDSEYGQLFDLSSAEAQARKFVGIISNYGDGTKDGTDEIGTVETFLNMRTAVNNNECSVGDYLLELDNITSMAENFSDEEQKQFKLAFGLDTDSIKEQYENIKNYVSRNYLNSLDTTGMTGFERSEYRDNEKRRIEEILDDLTASELAAVVKIKGEIDWQNTSTDEILAQIKDEAKFIEAMNYTISIDVETESLDSLNSALSESVSATGLSSDSITALKGRYSELASQGYDLSEMFEETSNGIHLNKKAVSEFEEALASQKISETDKQLDVLKDRYDELTDEINNCNDAGERASLYSDQQEVAQKINDLATLASQYKGLTSAYNAWQNAESAGNERDMYENIIEGFETIEDEISRGWYDDGTIEFLELITGQTDLAGKSASELKEIWNSLDDTIKGTSYSVKDFFTVDEDGNSTSTGAYNFLRAVEELGKNGGLEAVKDEAGNLMDISKLVERNADGKIVSFDFGVVGGDKAVADALGVSEEMVQIIQRTLDDAGFVVTLDGKYTLLADLKTSAEEANNSLKKLQSEGLKNLEDLDLNFDFNVDTVEGYQEQLEKALGVLDKFRNEDGTLQTDKNGNLIEGAEEALEIAEYYTAAMDELTEPQFMQIDTSTVDEELQDPIEKMQTIGDLCKEKHLVSLTGDTEDLKEVQDEIDKVAKELEELDDDVKAEIGIDPQWDAKTIAEKIEKGEIEIPAELQLDVQMSEDLKDMKLLMMRQLGLVSEEEVKLKVGYEIDDSTVDDLTPDEQKVVVEFISENEDWFDKLTDDKKEIVIDLVGNGVDLSSLENKEVIIDFAVENKDIWNKLSAEETVIAVKLISENQEWFNKLSEGKQEIAIEIISSGIDLNSLEDKNKEIVLEFVAKNEEWFNTLSETEKKIAVDLVTNGVDLSSLTEEERKEIIVEFSTTNEQEYEEKLQELNEKSTLEKVCEVTLLPMMSKSANNLADIIGEFTVEEQEVVLRFLADTSEYDSFEAEDKEAVVKFLADVTNVEGYTPEEKEAYARYIADGGNVNAYTPEEKEAIAKYLVDGGDIDSYSPADKDAIVKFLKNTVDIDDYTPEQKKAIAKFIKDSIDVDNYKMPTNKWAYAKYFKETHDIDIWTPEVKEGTASYTPFLASTSLPSITGLTAWYTPKIAGSGGVNGTANVNGTAFAGGTTGRAFKHGDWGTKDSGVALMGELGRETIVRDGKFFTVGDSGAGFYQYKKGDIIFNHKQTEELFKNGIVTSGGGRGKALVSGTAFSSGSGGGVEATVSSYSVGSSSSSSSDDDFEETFDWIETAIDRIERVIDGLDTKVNSVYRSWSERNSNLTSEISKVRNEISLQQKAYDEYMSAADDVGLSSYWIDKIENGSIDITTVTDEDLADKIEDYQEW